MTAHRAVFCGTAAFAVPSLRGLVDAGISVELVVTQPDRPGSRMRPAPRPVRDEALRLGLEVVQPERIRNPESVERLRQTAPDVIVVAAYGQIVPASLLQIPTLGCLNVHASLLPRWRGAAPVQHAILGGDQVTGVTIMQMDEELDHGPILAQSEAPIGPKDYAPELTERLAILGGELLVDTLGRLEQIEPREQDQSAATYAGKLSKQAGELAWQVDAVVIDRHVRALQPWPGVTLPFAGTRVKVLRGSLRSGRGAPGEILGSGVEGVEVACGAGSYLLEEVQVPTRRPVAARTLVSSRA